MHVHGDTTFARPQKTHNTNTHTRTHLHGKDKTNEDCISFTRRCRQALIKHACHVFPGYLPPRTHRRAQNNPNRGCRKYRSVLCWHAPSSFDRQLFYHAPHVNTARGKKEKKEKHTHGLMYDHIWREVCAPTHAVNNSKPWLRGERSLLIKLLRGNI